MSTCDCSTESGSSSPDEELGFSIWKEKSVCGDEAE